jgi:hypothetical protein
MVETVVHIVRRYSPGELSREVQILLESLFE